MKALFTAFFLCLCVLLYAQDSPGNKDAGVKSASVSQAVTSATSTIKKTAASSVKKANVRKPIVNLSFTYRYYQTYKDKQKGFDSTRLWKEAKLKNTFENKGSIIHNTSKDYLKWKLKDESESEYFYIFKIYGDNYAMTASGIRYFRYTDEELGPSVAVFYPEKSLWIIYRQNLMPKKI